MTLKTGQITGGFASDIVGPKGTFEHKFEKVGTSIITVDYIPT
jgi:hypothetical protein